MGEHVVNVFSPIFFKNLFESLFFDTILSIIRLDKIKGYNFSHS
jgi:hypothetical protein